jgi:hypothetical protein
LGLADAAAGEEEKNAAVPRRGLVFAAAKHRAGAPVATGKGWGQCMVFDVTEGGESDEDITVSVKQRRRVLSSTLQQQQAQALQCSMASTCSICCTR